VTSELLVRDLTIIPSHVKVTITCPSYDPNNSRKALKKVAIYCKIVFKKVKITNWW